MLSWQSFPTHRHPFLSPSFFGSLSSSIFWSVDITHNLGPNSLFLSHHALSLTNRIHSQSNQKETQNLSLEPLPLIWPSGCYTCFCLGKLTSNSPGSFAHFSISVNRTHILLLHRFKTEVNSVLFPLHPTKYLDGPQFLSKLKFIYRFYLLYGYV